MPQERIQIKASFDYGDLDVEEIEAKSLQILQVVKESDIAENVSFVESSEVIEGTKAGFSTMWGMLNVEVSLPNVGKLFNFLFDRFGDKPIELEIEHNGKKLKVKASSRQELSMAIEAANQFLNNTAGN